MKVVHLTKSDSTAAGRAAFALHNSLRQLGCESEILVANGGDCESLAAAREEREGAAIFRILQQRGFDDNAAHPHASLFTVGYPGTGILDHPRVRVADTIHLHDVAGMVSPAAIGALLGGEKRVVLSLYDQWAFTGGCHSPVYCEKFQTGCAGCPQLGEDRVGLPQCILEDKRAWFGSGELQVIAPSGFVAEQALSSLPLRDATVRVIAPGLDRASLPRIDKQTARKSLKLPCEGLVVVISSETTGQTQRGLQSVKRLIEDSLHFNVFKRLSGDKRLTIALLGAGEDILVPPLSVIRYDSPAGHGALGTLLSAADFALLPRVEENNAPIILEMMHCGLPVLAFNASDAGSYVQSGRTGQLVECWDSRRMAEAASHLALDAEQLEEMSSLARACADKQPDILETARACLDVYRTPRAPSSRERTGSEALRADFHARCLIATHRLLDRDARFDPEAAGDSARKEIRQVVANTLNKLALMDRRLKLLAKSADRGAQADFPKVLKSLSKLQVSLKHRLIRVLSQRLDRLPPRENLRRGDPAPPAPMQGNFTKSAERFALRIADFFKIMSSDEQLRKSGLGVLNQHEPRPLALEHFPRRKSRGGLPSIAIVTPSFMQGHFIEKTIRSVIDQDYPDVRYAVQDAGSTDDTIQVLKKHSHRISSWASHPDTGQSRAILLGFQKVSGEIMAYLNSDDTLMPGALRYVGDYFRAHSDVDAVYGHRVVIDENDQEVGRWVLPPHDRDLLRWADYVPQETLFWRRQLWDKVQGVDPMFRFAIDWDLLLRFEEAGAKIVRLPYFIGCFRVHLLQKTSAAMEKIGAEEVAYLRLRTLGQLPKPEEVGNMCRAARRRSAFYGWLLKNGIRL